MNFTLQNGAKKKSNLTDNIEKYFPISPLILRTETVSDFQVFLKQEKKYVLYTKEKELYTEDLKIRLYDNGIDKVFVPKSQGLEYEQYIKENFESILNDERIPIKERSKIFYSSSLDHIKGLFDTIYNKELNKKDVDHLETHIKSSLEFLSRDNVLENIGKLVSHDYKTYSHCLHVFTYSTSLMLRLNYDKDRIINAGVGAMLHDIGKSSIPKRILNKPGKLEADEWELIKTHPVQGLGLCSMMSLSHTTLNCILMHHEKCDGSGYPCGLKKDALPLEIRILTCCDIYDAITSNRPYAKAESSFSALNTMRHHMKDALDMNVFSEFVLMLSDANITSR